VKSPLPKNGFVIVSTTVDSRAAAARLADGILDERLAACVQQTRIRSTYRWNGRVERAAEYRLLAKTRAGLARRLMAFIAKRHPYELPEIVVTPIAGGSRAYLAWIAAETGAGKRER
jgi:periplasmic divalent cation tolerance protein